MIDKKNMQNLLIYISFNIGFITRERNEFLFHEGDVADNFYIILQGKVNILISQPIVKCINADQYFQILCEMEKKDFYNLILKTIKANHSIFPIPLEDLLILDIEEIYFRHEILNNIKETFDILVLKKIFDTFNREPLEYHIDFEFIEQKLKTTKNYYNTIQLFKENFERLLNSDLNISQYNYLENNELFNLLIFENQYFMTLNEGEYFGDFALDSEISIKTRKASIECFDDCSFGVINEETYINYLFEEKRKIWENELVFFIENFFFLHIKKNVFQNEYFSFFQLCKENKRTILYKEGDILDWIYFLKEGELELSINLNIADLNNLIDALTIVTNTKNDIYPMMTKFQYIKNDLTKIQKHKIFNLNLKQEFGLIEYVYKYPAIYTLQVVSESAVFYKLSLRNLETILSRESSCKGIIKQKAKGSLDILLNRLIDIRNSMLSLIDHKSILENETLKKKRNLDLEEKKLLSKEKDPKINFQANFKPQIYSKLSNDKHRNNQSMISGIRSNELNKIDPISFTEKKLNEKKGNSVHNSIIRNYDEFNNSTIKIHNFIPDKKIIVSKKDIEKELKLLNNFYEKTRKPITQHNILNLPTLSSQYQKTIKTKNNLPYSFISQNSIRKSKSNYKVKLLKDSMIDDYINEENSLSINQSKNIFIKRNISPKGGRNLSTVSKRNSDEF